MSEVSLFDGEFAPRVGGGSPADHFPAPGSVPTVGFLDFHGEIIPVLVNESGRWPSVTRMSHAMGIDGNGQRQAIERKHWAQGMTCMTHVQVPGDRQRRPHFFIHEKRVPMWLANIDTTRLADPTARERVELWQIEFADVLAEWVETGQVTPKGAVLDRFDPTDLDSIEALVRSASVAVAAVRQERAARQIAESRVAELEPKADGFDVFLSIEGTVKWANACQDLGVGPVLFGAYLRDRGVLITDEYTVTRNGAEETRQGERHNMPYAPYAHWFDFPALVGDPARLARVPEGRQHDRRVTKAGRAGLLKLVKRHVIECGRCSMCDQFRSRKPDTYAAWRPATLSIGA